MDLEDLRRGYLRQIISNPKVSTEITLRPLEIIFNNRNNT